MSWGFEDGICLKMDRFFFGWERDAYLIFVYMKPITSSRGDLDNDVSCFETLENKIAEVSNLGNVMCLGDFNARVSERLECMVMKENEDVTTDENFMFNINYSQDKVFDEADFIANDMSIDRANMDKHVNSYGLKLLSLCNVCDLAILNGRAGSDKGVGKFTFCGHQGVSTNDLVLCDKYMLQNVCNFSIGEPNIFTDHCTVSFELKFTNVNEYVCNKGNKKMYSKWKNEKKEEYLKLIRSEIVGERVEKVCEVLQANENIDNLEMAIEELTDIILDAGDGHIKERKVESTYVEGRRTEDQRGEWYDGECRQQKNIFIERQRRYLETREDVDRIAMCKERNIYRKLCRSKKQQLDKKEASRLVELSENDAKAFWREIKKSRERESSLPDCNFFDHFRTLAERESRVGEEGTQEIDNSTNHGKVVDDLDRPIELRELETTILELKKEKASGNDLVLNEFIINSSMCIKILILTIFNSVLHLEHFPSFWCRGSIVPIFKKGDKFNANNYRGITILSCMGKLFTRLMNNRLTSWAENENKICNSQYGFRKHRSTTDCIFILKGLIDLLFAQGKKLYTAFIDYEKCYDYLDRAAVFYKLSKSGVSSKCINIIKSMYSKMKLNVRNENENQCFMSNCGLLQGESTSPLLFALFVSDLNEVYSDTHMGINIVDTIIDMLMFADDTVIFSETKEGLQKSLDKLWNYCTKWGLTVNTSKTKVVVFRKGGRLKENDRWMYGENILDNVSSFKYLGCVISSRGSFSQCIDDLAKSGQRALFGLKQCFGRFPEMLPHMQLNLFKSLVSPILSYGSEIWGASKADQVDKTYSSFFKSILCVKSSTPSCVVY